MDCRAMASAAGTPASPSKAPFGANSEKIAVPLIISLDVTVANPTSSGGRPVDTYFCETPGPSVNEMVLPLLGCPAPSTNVAGNGVPLDFVNVTRPEAVAVD